MSFFKKQSRYDFLIVGLGNPTPKYFNNRHNVGFQVLDILMKRHSVTPVKIKAAGMAFNLKFEGKNCLILKPLDFMNNSGRVTKEVADYFKIPLENIIVIYDDVSLPVGKIRIREKGSAGGHNGVKDIIAYFGSESFLRIKIGVGNKPNPEYDLAAWVLSDFKKEEKEPLEAAESRAADSLKYLVSGEIEKAKSTQNP